MTEILKHLSSAVKEQMANCKFCIDSQKMTVDLAKDCFEIAQAMLNNFRAIKEEGDFKNDDPRLVDELEKNLVFWTDSSKELWDGFSGISLVFRNCNI